MTMATTDPDTTLDPTAGATADEKPTKGKRARAKASGPAITATGMARYLCTQVQHGRFEGDEEKCPSWADHLAAGEKLVRMYGE